MELIQDEAVKVKIVLLLLNFAIFNSLGRCANIHIWLAVYGTNGE